MQHNILRDSNVTKIYLMYVDAGTRKKVQVKLRFMDAKECYFATPTPRGFVKPKRKIPAELNVYTTDGVYKTKVTLLDSNMSLNEVMYEVSIPNKWDFVQLRSSSRKEVELPIEITFNDGFKITTTTRDISLGGISFVSKEPFNSIYKKISCILTLTLPQKVLINFADGKMTTEAKFVRESEPNDFGEVLYSFKFCSIKPDDEEVLKNYLLRLDF